MDWGDGTIDHYPDMIGGVSPLASHTYAAGATKAAIKVMPNPYNYNGIVAFDLVAGNSLFTLIDVTKTRPEANVTVGVPGNRQWHPADPVWKGKCHVYRDMRWEKKSTNLLNAASPHSYWYAGASFHGAYGHLRTPLYYVYGKSFFANSRLTLEEGFMMPNVENLDQTFVNNAPFNENTMCNSFWLNLNNVQTANETFKNTTIAFDLPDGARCPKLSSATKLFMGAQFPAAPCRAAFGKASLQ